MSPLRGGAGPKFLVQKMSTKEMISQEYRWLVCPNCGTRTRTKIYHNTVLLHFPLYCARCKRESIVGVIKFNMVVSDEPDA